VIDTEEVYFDLVLSEAFARADLAVQRWGLHSSCEFTCCRLAEEAGELIKAATSGSEKRPRSEAMHDELVDVVAMLIRLFREWPSGLLGQSIGRRGSPVE
jgi:NTP pyrophosphatase (non-canonical NTP hydrolase)